MLDIKDDTTRYKVKIDTKTSVSVAFKYEKGKLNKGKENDKTREYKKQK
ncbi:hypothetical protein [Shewanella sp. NIFS-20-20]|nr:hypothetical protein [Shewanella sp. NIFS-20-20]MBV7316466.1 hypothetical protein [Shewanella sp. NIFS-20-20]